MHKWLVFASFFLISEAFTATPSRLHRWKHPLAARNAFPRLKTGFRAPRKLQAKATLPAEVAAEFFDIDFANQNPKGVSRDLWDLVLDPQARGRMIVDQLQQFYMRSAQSDSSKVPLEKDERLSAKDFPTVMHALLEHMPKIDMSMLSDPVDAPWRIALLDAMRHVLLLKNFHLVDPTWSFIDLNLSISKIDSHELVTQEEGNALAETMQLTVMDRCPSEYWKKLDLYRINVQQFHTDPKLLVLQKQFDENKGKMVIVKTWGNLKHKPVYIGKLISRQPMTVTLNIQGSDVELQVPAIAEVRLPDAFLTEAEVKRAQKDQPNSLHWIPKTEAYQGEIDPPHIPPCNKTWEQQFPGMVNFRTDYEPVELLRGFNLTHVLQNAEIMLGEDAKQHYPAHFQHNQNPQQMAIKDFQGRKLTPEEIADLKAQIEAQQARIAGERTSRALAAYQARRAKRFSGGPVSSLPVSLPENAER